ncbi:transmembrane anchor protein [Shimia sp. MMG029]|uniref:transmembrane anchor protein n=1 Tax=Shimia sp. MMG029 TaxID=3021978 RepID=UPI0022FDF96D|nr:transmembrane anchor protein [Shimia sp. MMG029]MDA5555336.1 transmembrane anchor protein [Shimia sp. MMG029]
MFNSNKPTLEELPTTAQLLRSTFIAAASALVILITAVLPAEYGIDPTRVGRLLGLAEMGEIKSQLATEAEEDRQRDASDNDQSNFLNDILGIFVSTAYAQEVVVWRDEVTFALEPGASAEWKLEMTQGQSAQFRMIVDGGRVNFDLHGHGSGQSVTYEKGRGSTGSEGTILAEFDGSHGWFWRNRDKQAVTITVQVRGEYKAFKDAS